MVQCSKCGQEVLPEKLLVIESEIDKYYFCESCIVESNKLLSMKMFLNKDERALLKKIRKFIKYKKN